jgi:hypothetical protein
MPKKNNIKKILSSNFLKFNKFHSIITYFINFLFVFQLLNFIMEGNLVLAFLDVLVIEYFFSKLLNNVSLELLCKEDPPFWDF